MSTRVAIQGITTSFHEVAAQKFFGKDIKCVDCMTFVDLFEALKNDQADYAVMAIENTVAGSLLQNYGLLQEYHFNIIGEVYLRIEMMLMALPGTKIEDLDTVQSHPIAIRQCHHFLHSLEHVKLIEKEDTALCAKHIAEHKITGSAAVANEAAANHFGLEILARNIETNKKNYTRFVILSKQPVIDEKNNKASIIFNLPHDPGSLAKVLTVLAEHEINLTKIQSVPIIGTPYKYNFHVDVIWEKYANFQNALKAIDSITLNLSVLGEYPRENFDLLLS
jgi:prephenate dehydratase